MDADLAFARLAEHARLIAAGGETRLPALAAQPEAARGRPAQRPPAAP